MYIHSIKLTNYKSIGNYNENEIIIEPRVTAIIGKNESGKSNVLEGMSKIRFLSRNEAAFLEENVNRQAESGTFNSFLITLKHIKDEIEKGANTDTTILITKESYSATGGIVGFYTNTVKKTLTALVELLKGINNNPFGLSGQDYTDYTTYLNETENEDNINFYRITYFIDLCKRRVNNIPQNKRENYKSILQEVQTAWDSFGSIFPTFFYRSTNKTLNSSYKYDEINSELNNPSVNPNSLIRELVKIIGVSHSDFLSACQQGSKATQITQRNNIKRLINQKLNKAFHEFYKTEKLYLGIEFNAGIITFTINKEDGTTLLLSERSNGLRWYLNLFIDMLANGAIKNNVVFLLDEPGTNLHVNAQRELLRLFNHLADNGNQIVYTTHSPYMLDMENDGIHRIRAVVKNDDENTYIYKTAYDSRITPDSQNDTLTPIIRALGMNLLDTFGPAKDKLNVITEGSSDYIYITLMAKQLGIDLSKVAFIPSQGATNCVNIAMILHGWGCRYVALFDYDKEGVEEGGEQIRKTFGSKIGENFQYIVDVKQEDVDAYTYKQSPKMVEDLMVRSEISRFCSEHKISKVGKPLTAKLLSNAVENGSFTLNETTKTNFMAVFRRLGIN